MLMGAASMQIDETTATQNGFLSNASRTLASRIEEDQLSCYSFRWRQL